MRDVVLQYGMAGDAKVPYRMYLRRLLLSGPLQTAVGNVTMTFKFGPNEIHSRTIDYTQ